MPGSNIPLASTNGAARPFDMALPYPQHGGADRHGTLSVPGPGAAMEPDKKRVPEGSRRGTRTHLFVHGQRGVPPLLRPVPPGTEDEIEGELASLFEEIRESTIANADLNMDGVDLWI